MKAGSYWGPPRRASLVGAAGHPPPAAFEMIPLHRSKFKMLVASESRKMLPLRIICNILTSFPRELENAHQNPDLYMILRILLVPFHRRPLHPIPQRPFCLTAIQV
jgi:hypothetical protein